MRKELVITCLTKDGVPYLACGLFEDKKAVELRLVPKDKKSILGNIYVGQVEKLVKNLDAAFVQIDRDTPCYYEPKVKAQPGECLVVQVSRDAAKLKAPTVTTNLSFTGKYLVLTTENKVFGFSAKLDKEKKEVLRQWIAPLWDGVGGLVVRTNASYAEKGEILEELEFLKKRRDRILAIGPHRTAYTMLEEAPPFYIEAIRDLCGEDCTRIVTDEPECCEKIQAYLSDYQKRDVEKLEFYEDKLLPLSGLFSMGAVLDQVQKERVWLPSGGFLIIEQTEAFVSVDVNSGKYVSKKKAQESYRKVNLEAASEIARQLRLRNLSGIILIDFINLEREEHREELLHVLQKQLRRDPVKTQVIDMTPLQIVEVTRQRIRKSLTEEKSH